MSLEDSKQRQTCYVHFLTAFTCFDLNSVAIRSLHLKRRFNKNRNLHGF